MAAQVGVRGDAALGCRGLEAEEPRLRVDRPSRDRDGEQVDLSQLVCAVAALLGSTLGDEVAEAERHDLRLHRPPRFACDLGALKVELALDVQSLAGNL